MTEREPERSAAVAVGPEVVEPVAVAVVAVAAGSVSLLRE